MPHGDLDGIAFDLAKRTIAIDRVEARPLALSVIRQPRVAPTPTTMAAPAKTVSTTTAHGAGSHGSAKTTGASGAVKGASAAKSTDGRSPLERVPGSYRVRHRRPGTVVCNGA